MAEEQDRASKTEEPTAKRLEDARKKGDVAKSADIAPLASLAAATGMILLGGGWMARSMTESLMPFVTHPDAIDLSGRGANGVMQAAMVASAPVLLILVAAAIAGAAGNLLQHGLLWAPKKIAPDVSKVNPLKGLGRIFGVDALMNFLKQLVKITAVGLIAWLILEPRANELAGLAAVAPGAILPLSFDMIRAVVIAILFVMAVVAMLDWFWSRHRFIQRMRMTREEVKREHKESDGDPQVKARQRQLRLQRSRRRMIQNVPKATVVVMNPTHYAVALRYEQGETPAPVCIAKGVDRVALKIREVAEAHGVTVIEDPPLARALYAAIEVDETIPQEHYQAVAQIIGFILGEGRKSARDQARPIPTTAR